MRICSYVKTWSLIIAPSFPWGSIFKQNWIFLKFHSKIQVFWPNCFIKEELPRDFQLLLITCICSWKRVCPFILTNLHSVCLEFLYSIFVGIDLCFWGRSQKCKKVYCRTEKKDRRIDRQKDRQEDRYQQTDRRRTKGDQKNSLGLSSSDELKTENKRKITQRCSFCLSKTRKFNKKTKHVPL